MCERERERECVCVRERECVCVCVCHQSTARAIRERTSPNPFSRRTIVIHYSRVSRDRIIAASAVFSNRDIITNAINHSALNQIKSCIHEICINVHSLFFISLLIIPCIIYHVTNKETLNLELWLFSSL